MLGAETAGGRHINTVGPMVSAVCVEAQNSNPRSSGEIHHLAHSPHPHVSKQLPHSVYGFNMEHNKQSDFLKMFTEQIMRRMKKRHRGHCIPRESLTWNAAPQDLPSPARLPGLPGSPTTSITLPFPSVFILPTISLLIVSHVQTTRSVRTGLLPSESAGSTAGLGRQEVQFSIC